MVRARIAGWTLIAATRHVGSLSEFIRRAVDAAGDLAVPALCDEILRDDARSFVGVLEMNGRRVVAKSPRGSDRRRWIRLTTLWRPGLARRAIAFLEAAHGAGLPVAEPWGAIERRRRGRVCDSWLFHAYLGGRACALADLPRVVDTLRRLHEAGWSHGDAHIANFLAADERVCILDADPRRRPWGRVSEAYDFVRLRRSLIDTRLLAAADARHLAWPIAPTAPAFRLAAGFERGQRLWRGIKRRWRSRPG